MSTKAINLSFILTILLFLPACGSLIYAEQTGFNLAIKVNNDKARPVKVNAGLERTVTTIAPPVGDTESETPGEAVSMVSLFDLEYEDREEPLQGTLTVSTRFLSGAAALQVTEEEADLIVNKEPAEFAVTETTKRIREWLKTDGAARKQQLKDWLDEDAPTVGLTRLRFGREYEAERKAAIEDLKIP